MSDSEVKSIAEIKNNKKLKKLLSPEALVSKQNNIKKALEAKAQKFEDRKKLKLVENNISNLINNDISSSEDDEHFKINLKKEKKKKNDITPEKNNNNNDYKLLMDHITNINKKVEKLYIMKKNKPLKTPQPSVPVYVNTKNDKSDDLLNAIRNKMLNN